MQGRIVGGLKFIHQKYLEVKNLYRSGQSVGPRFAPRSGSGSRSGPNAIP